MRFYFREGGSVLSKCLQVAGVATLSLLAVFWIAFRLVTLKHELDKADSLKASDGDQQYVEDTGPQPQDQKSGFWISRSTKKGDDRVVLSIGKPAEMGDGVVYDTAGDKVQCFEQSFSRVLIGRKLECAERVFLHDFKVDFTQPNPSESDHKPAGRGVWIACNATGSASIGYDSDKLTVIEKQTGSPVRRWFKTSGKLLTMIAGRNLQRGETAFVHDPKVHENPPWFSRQVSSH